MDIKECLFGRSISYCTWMQHSVIAAIPVVIVGIFLGWYAYLSAAAVSAYFIWRETQGPDQNIPWYKRLVASRDRIGDWVSPTVVSFIVATLLYLLV